MKEAYWLITRGSLRGSFSWNTPLRADITFPGTGRVGTVFMFSLCSTQSSSISPSGSFLCVGYPSLGGCCPEDAFWVPWDCNNGESSWKATTPRTLHRKQDETPPALPRERPTCLSWSFGLRGRPWVGTHPEAMSGDIGQRAHL